MFASSSETSDRLLHMAQHNAERYRANPKIKAIILTGSVAQGIADEFSDIDTILYYETPPSKEEFEAACAEARASGGGVYGGSAAAGFGVYTFIDGVRCDFGHNLVAEAEALLAEMLHEPDLDEINKQIAVSGFVNARPLHGAAWVEGWQGKLANYPAALGTATIKKHLRFSPHWVLQKMGAERGDLLFLHELLFDAAKNIFGILCGLNQFYHPGKLKGAAWTIRRMQHKPNDLLARLNRMISAPADEAIALRAALIDETLTLLEAHRPDIDTTRNRKLLDLTM